MSDFVKDTSVPTNDCISRQAAITIPILPKEHREYQTMNLDDAYESGWLDCQECIEKLPSAQSEMKHGKWIDNNGLYQCSVCKHIWSELWWTETCPIDRMNKMMHYCPNCGAKIDENKERD